MISPEDENDLLETDKALVTLLSSLNTKSVDSDEAAEDTFPYSPFEIESDITSFQEQLGEDTEPASENHEVNFDELKFLSQNDLAILDPNDIENLLSNTGGSINNLHQLGDSFQAFNENVSLVEDMQFNTEVYHVDVHSQLPLCVIEEIELLDEEMTFSNTISPPVPKDEKSNWLLIPVPKKLQNKRAIKNIPSIDVSSSVMEKINDASSGHHGAIFPSIEDVSRRQTIVRRPPLQMIQQNIQRSIKEPPKTRISKRKQNFYYSRDDTIMFMEDFHDESSEKTLRVDKTSNNKTGISHEDRDEKIEETYIEGQQECPKCHKMFKKLMLHIKKCREGNLMQSGSKPTEVPVGNAFQLKFSCSVCDRSFRRETFLNSHMETHEEMRCKFCKVIQKSSRRLKSHMSKCAQSFDVQKYILERCSRSRAANKEN